MAIDREAVLSWYRRNRERSSALFELLTAESLYSQPISLRHPVIFYVGHLPAFSFNTLVKRGLGRPSIDARLEVLFARGIDPDPTDDVNPKADAPTKRPDAWPRLDDVRAFVAEADRQVIDALAHGDLERSGDPLLDR